MSEMKAYLEGRYPGYASGGMYIGYMDMTYFAFTPPRLRDMKLKIALVYLHQECRFEVWLAAANRKIQAQFINILRNKDTGRYKLSEAAPGVDAIIAAVIAAKPDFDNAEKLKRQIEDAMMRFISDLYEMLLR